MYRMRRPYRLGPSIEDGGPRFHSLLAPTHFGDCSRLTLQRLSLYHAGRLLR